MEDMDYSLPTEVEEPDDRISFLENFSRRNAVRVDSNIPVLRYYYYGLEILQTANCYFNENNWEKSFLFYLKFTLLFSEEIIKHPDFETDLKDKKIYIETKLHKVFCKTMLVRERLRFQYEEEFRKFIKAKQNNEPFIPKRSSIIPASEDYQLDVLQDLWTPVSKYTVNMRLGLLD